MIILGQAVDTVAFRSGESAPITVKAGTRVKILNVIGSVATCGVGSGHIGMTFNVPTSVLYRTAVDKPIDEESEEDEASGIELVNVPAPKILDETPTAEALPSDVSEVPDAPSDSAQAFLDELAGPTAEPVTPVKPEDDDDMDSLLRSIEEGETERAQSLAEQLHLDVGDEPPVEGEVGQGTISEPSVGTMEELKSALEAEAERKRRLGETPKTSDDEIVFKDDDGRSIVNPNALKYMKGRTMYPNDGVHKGRFWFIQFPEKSSITVYDALGPGNYMGERGREWEAMNKRGAENIANAVLKAERDMARQPVSEPFGGWLIVPSILYEATPPVLIYKVYDPKSGVKVTKHRVIADKPPYISHMTKDEAKQWITLAGAPR